jgi:Lrp/AsnC family transcriptional regulator for asnA, asnC and gidA
MSSEKTGKILNSSSVSPNNAGYQTMSGQVTDPTNAAGVDDVDRDIIRVLQRDGRTSATEIGRALGLTETTIRKRISRLTSEGTMRVVAVPAPEALGATTSAIIGISVKLSALEAALAQLVTSPEVRYVGASTGRYDLIVEAFFADHEHLLRFIAQTLGALDGVTQVETSLILKVAKFSYEWEMP